MQKEKDKVKQLLQEARELAVQIAKEDHEYSFLAICGNQDGKFFHSMVTRKDLIGNMLFTLALHDTNFNHEIINACASYADVNGMRLIAIEKSKD